MVASEGIVSVSVPDPNAAETDGATPNTGTILVTLDRGTTAPTTTAVVVNYSVTGTAVGGVDYTALPASLTFVGLNLASVASSGATSVSIATLSGTTSLPVGSVLRLPGASTANTDDILVTVAAAATVTTVASPVTVSALPSATVAGTSYVQSLPLTVSVIDNQQVDPTRTVILTITSTANYTVSSTANQGTVTIADDEPIISIVALNASAAEPSSPTNAAVNGQFVISYAGLPIGTPLQRDVTVWYDIGGSATDGADYTSLSTVSLQLTVAAVSGDTTLSLRNAGGTAVVLPAGIVLRLPGATLSPADDVLVTVGTATTIPPVTTDPAVPVAPVGAASTVGIAYVMMGTVVIPAGSLSTTINVVPLYDSLTEGSEAVTLSLLDSVDLVSGGPNTGTYDNNATASLATATVNIADDTTSAGTASIVATTANASETDGATPHPGVFTVSFDRGAAPTNEAMLVTYGVGGTATSGVDYTALAGSLSFELLTLASTGAAGDTTLLLSSATGNPVVLPKGTILRLPGATTATTDDIQATLSAQATVTGSASTVAITALSGASLSGTVYVLSLPITVSVIDDLIIEPTETVTVQLNAGAHYGLSGTANQASVSILDDEPVISIVANDPLSQEPTTITGTANNGQFTVSYPGTPVGTALNRAVVVTYSVGGTASSGTDYSALTGTVTIPAGSLSNTINVVPLYDAILDGGETVIATLVDNGGAMAGTYDVSSTANSAIVTIRDSSDPPLYPTLQVLDSAAVQLARTGGSETISTALVNGVASSPLIYTVRNAAGGGALRLDMKAPSTTVVEVVSSTNCTPVITDLASPTDIQPGNQVTFPMVVTPSLPASSNFGSWSVVLRLHSVDNPATDLENEQDQTNSGDFMWTVSGTAQDAIAVLRSGTTIISNGGTDTATTATPTVAQNITYNMSNAGSKGLTFSGVTQGAAVNCVVTLPTFVNTPVAVGAPASTFVVTIQPIGPGNFSVPLTLTTNDPASLTYTWTLSGVYGPQLSVKRGTTTIVRNSSDTISGMSSTVPTLTAYTLTNVGQTALTISALSIGSKVNCSGATLFGSALPIVLAPNATTNLSLSIQANAAAAWSCQPTITADDPSLLPSGTFIWTAQSESPLTPTLSLTRDGGAIVNNGTDTVAASTVSLAQTLTYQITNQGLASMGTGAVAYSTSTINNCTVSLVQPGVALLGGGLTTTMQVIVTPIAAGPWSVQISETFGTPINTVSWTVTGGAAPYTPTATDLFGSSSSGCGAGAGMSGLLIALFAMVGLRRRNR